MNTTIHMAQATVRGSCPDIASATRRLSAKAHRDMYWTWCKLMGRRVIVQTSAKSAYFSLSFFLRGFCLPSRLATCLASLSPHLCVSYVICCAFTHALHKSFTPDSLRRHSGDSRNPQ